MREPDSCANPGAAPAGQPIRIMLAVLTTGVRSGPLRKCVQGINRLKQVDGVRLDLVIVQNASPEISADVAALQTETGGFSAVILEPRTGIPHARNCAIRHAIRLDYDFIAFIDDDAVPDEDWLVESMRVLRVCGGEAVTGPQHPVFPPDAPRRLSKAAIYKAVDHRPGRPCRWAASNNVIFSAPFVRDHQLLLDETFTTGGSDKSFFRRFARAGGRIWWAPDAIVREDVTPERLTLRWALRRSWRLGTTGFRIERSGRPLAAALAISLVKGAVYIGAGLALLPTCLIPRHAGCIDGLCYITHGAGFMLGISPVFRPRQYS